MLMLMLIQPLFPRQMHYTEQTRQSARKETRPKQPAWWGCAFVQRFRPVSMYRLNWSALSQGLSPGLPLRLRRSFHDMPGRRNISRPKPSTKSNVPLSSPSPGSITLTTSARSQRRNKSVSSQPARRQKNLRPELDSPIAPRTHNMEQIPWYNEKNHVWSYSDTDTEPVIEHPLQPRRKERVEN
jgi:hypothetical protein